MEILEDMRKRNVRILMHPVSIIPDPFYQVVRKKEDIHRIIREMNGASVGFRQNMQHQAMSVQSIPDHMKNSNPSPNPMLQSQFSKANNRIPVFVLKSSNEEFRDFSNAFLATYRQNPQIDAR